jgi:hypothetical protein
VTTVRIDLERPPFDRVREMARLDHRPVLWQLEQLLSEAIEHRLAETTRKAEPNR